MKDMLSVEDCFFCKNVKKIIAADSYWDFLSVTRIKKQSKTCIKETITICIGEMMNQLL